MRFVNPRIVWFVLLLLLLILSVRLLWIASRLETGLPTLANDWRNSTLSWLLGTYAPVPARPPAQQAEFWLAETDRLLRAHPNDARLTMAAALVLDSPGTDYFRSHLLAIRLTSVGRIPEMDSKAIERAENEFEERCKSRCLELAAKATEMEPENTNWWRLRAILLFRRLGWPKEQRDSQWAIVLDHCQSHDPENALYDYLAAYLLLESSAKRKYADGNTQVLIQNEQTWKEGIRHLDSAQSKPFLAVDDTVFAATAELLALANIAPTDHPNVIDSRQFHLRRSLIIHFLWRWLFSLAEVKASDGDIPAAVALRRQSLHMITQYRGAGLSTANDSEIQQLRTWTADWMRKIAVEHPEAVSPGENEQFIVAYEEALLEQRILREAARTLPKNQPQPKRGLTLLGILKNDSEIFLVVTPQLLLALFLVALIASAVSRSLPVAPAHLGIFSHVVALLCAIVASIFVFALAPAGIIPPAVQAWIATIPLLLIPSSLIGSFVWRALKRRRFQFSLRFLLIATLILSLLPVAATAPIVMSTFDDLPFDLFLRPYLWNDAVDADSFGKWFTAQGTQAWWAMAQWVAYHGHLWTIAFWATFVTLLCLIKLRRSALSAPSAVPLSSAVRLLATVSASLTRPAFLLSALTLLAYLLLEPAHLAAIDRHYQQDMAFARDPVAYWKMVDDAVQKVRSNPTLMAEIQQEVDSK